MCSRAADFSAREDALTATTEAPFTAINTRTRVLFAAVGATTLTLWATSESAVSCRTALTARAALAFAACHSFTRIYTPLSGTLFSFKFTTADHTPRYAYAVSTEGLISGTTITTLL
jgi:hypothetical protein